MSQSSKIFLIKKEKLFKIDFGKANVFFLVGISLTPNDKTCD